MFNIILYFKGFRIKKASQYRKVLYNELLNLGLNSYQEKKKWEIFYWHKNQNTGYQKHCKYEPANWEDIPILTKNDFQAGVQAWLATPYKHRKVFISSTSGSSGHPFWFAKDKFCHALSWSFIQDIYKSSGIEPRSKQARFYGIPLHGKSARIEKLKDFLMNRYRFPVFDLSDTRLKSYLVVFEQQKFDYIYGYTSALVLFARYCIRCGKTLKEVCPSLKLCVYTSEVAREEDRKILAKGFGVPIKSEYGASEVGVVAFENQRNELVVDDALLYLEEYELADGSRTTLVTALYNRAFPIIRYDIGDIVTLNRNLGKTIIEELVGRTNDVVELPGGKSAAGLTFYYISRSILEKGGGLKEFIIRQTALDHFVFDIICSEKLTIDEETIIRDETKRYLTDGLKVEFNYVTEIPRLKNGKIKHFISEL